MFPIWESQFGITAVSTIKVRLDFDDSYRDILNYVDQRNDWISFFQISAHSLGFGKPYRWHRVSVMVRNSF